jgi:hypothetical protein
MPSHSSRTSSPPCLLRCHQPTRPGTSMRALSYRARSSSAATSPSSGRFSPVAAKTRDLEVARRTKRPDYGKSVPICVYAHIFYSSSQWYRQSCSSSSKAGLPSERLATRIRRISAIRRALTMPSCPKRWQKWRISPPRFDLLAVRLRDSETPRGLGRLAPR